MSLDIIKNKVKCGLFEEARKLIELETTAKLMNETKQSLSTDFPLLVMLSLVKNEDAAINLSRLLLEKGYSLNLSDRNGLCALNYALVLKRLRLLSLYLESFNFDLNTHHDIFENSFLHYLFAINDKDIIKKFASVYSKYYEWDPAKFSKLMNCDGISVQDLVDYYRILDKQTYRQTLNDNQYKVFFQLDSNPITICKFINKMFYNKSTFKLDTAFVLNSMNNNNSNNKSVALLNKRKSLTNTVNTSTGSITSIGVTSGSLNGKNQLKRDFKLYILNSFNSLNKPTFGLNFNNKDNSVLTYLPNRNANQYYNNTPRVKTAGSNSTSQSIEIKLAKSTQYLNTNAQSHISNYEHMPKIVEPFKVQIKEDSSILPNFYDKRIISASVAPAPPINRPGTTNYTKPSSSAPKASSKLHDYLTWKSDLKKIYGHYSIMVSPSYRVASAYVPRPISELDLQSSQILEDTSKSSLENSNPNMNTTHRNTHSPSNEKPKSHSPNNEKPKSSSNNSTPTSVNNSSNVTNAVQYSITTTSGNSENPKDKITKLDMFLIPGSLLNNKGKNSQNRMKIVTDSSNINN